MAEDVEKQVFCALKVEVKIGTMTSEQSIKIKTISTRCSVYACSSSPQEAEAGGSLGLGV
jgi:hypothetical protein